MKNRILSLLLAMVMLMTCLPANVWAAVDPSAYTNPTVLVENSIAAAGSTVNVDVLIVNNPGVAGAKFTVSYDEKLTLLAAKSGETFAALDYTKPGVFTSPCNFTWDSENTEATTDGVILTLTFQISEDAAANEKLAVNLSYRYGDIYDSDLDSLAFDMVSGYVQVLDYLPGDVNSDGVVNGKDITLCRRYNAGGYDISIRWEAGDVNDDNTINGKDITILRRFNAGGYDVVPKPHTPRCAHVMEATEEKAPTCEDDGNCAYWYCVNCKNYYTDEYGNTEIAKSATVLKATGHNVVLVPGYEATKDRPGLTDGKACNTPGCDYVELEQLEIPIITGHKISYDPVNGEDYVGKQNIVIPAEYLQYYTDEGLTLPQLQVPGYRFIGWSESQSSKDNIITEIPVGATKEYKLFAHWDVIPYKVYFDTPDVDVTGTDLSNNAILNATEYTVDQGKPLPVPKCYGYTFMGWSNDDGFIVTRIKPGSTGNITLHANWTSNRNKATSYASYGDPIIIEDNTKGRFYFVYNIGKIEKVPLNVIQDYSEREGITINEEFSYTDQVSTNFQQETTEMISKATTESSGWTLAKEWNDIYQIEEENKETSGKSKERTNENGSVVGGKYFVSNSNGGSSYESTESGSSMANSSKITTEDSWGVNSSLDLNSSTYTDAKLGVKNETEISAGISHPVGLGKAEAGIKNTTTIESEISSGRKDETAFHIDGSQSGYVGTVNTNDTSAYINSTTSNSSNWNSTSGYESSSEITKTDSVTDKIKEEISKTTTHNMSKALGETNTATGHTESSQLSSNEYATSIAYYKGTEATKKQSVESTVKEHGWYRMITSGTVHVYGVVGYDVATESYFTYCFNIMDDEVKVELDYSKNGDYQAAQNGLVTFEIPYDVNEYVAGMVGRTPGLEVNDSGVVTDYVPGADYTGTIVVPQWAPRRNDGATPFAVPVTKLDSNAFAKVRDTLEVVVLPRYITHIPDNTFANCTNLKTVIAFGVTSIGENAFAGCSSLGEIRTGDKVTYKPFRLDNHIISLGANAFKDVPAVEVAASSASVAESAIACGAKSISVNLSYITDSFNNKTITVGENTEYFRLIGNGGVYKNVSIVSDAEETVINYMTFENQTGTPWDFGSKKVGLYRANVAACDGFAMILRNEDVELKLLGEIVLNSTFPYTMLSQNVSVSKLEQGTTSSMTFDGEYLICGEVLSGESHIKGTRTSITEAIYNACLEPNTLSLNANGGTVAAAQKQIICGLPYGALPVPERNHYAFEGWFTQAEGGEQVTADMVVQQTADVELYAHWRALTATIHFDAANGYIDTASKVGYLGEPIGELPVPVMDYHNFVGWYTDLNERTNKVDSSTILTGDMTIYAHWDLKPVSGWVKKSEMPSGAWVINTKWIYDKTTNTSSSESYIEGWSLYHTEWKWSDYGVWSDWLTTAVSASDSRKVETKTIPATYKTQYNYSRYVSSDGWSGPWVGTWGGHYCNIYQERGWSDSPLAQTGSDGWGSNMFAIYGSWYNQITRQVETAAAYTMYRYCDRSKIYTYYHTKTEHLESATAVSASDSISNVVEWVQYREK